MKELIFAFWDYSEGRTKSFSFHEFFKEFERILYHKLASHCYLGLAGYIEVVMERYYDLEKLRFLEYKSVHTDREFMMDSILEGIFRPRYEHHRKKHENNDKYQKLLELYYEIKFHEKFIHSERVFLMDKCIHAMHNSGYILEIAAWREEYESSHMRR